jgi:SAM-dependent methyltransferase
MARGISAPPAVGWAVRRASEVVDSVALRRGYDGVPGRRLRARTGAPGRREFIEGGRDAARVLLDAAGPAERFSDVLDFGCGSGRVLPSVASLVPGGSCAGVDVDAEAIAWAARQFSELRWGVCGFDPPLEFDEASFDLVYSISVFSHLDSEAQDRWLAELARVLRPGGVALLSIHGPSAFEQFRTGAVRSGWTEGDAFDRHPLGLDEFAFMPYVRSRWNAADLPGVGGDYGLAFHGHGYVRQRWSQWFSVARIQERALAGWQDLVVCNAPGGA